MNRCFPILLAGTVLALTAPAISQTQNLAHLSRGTLDLPHSRDTVLNHGPSGHGAHARPLPESALSRAAARSLFVNSNLDAANLLARRALRNNSQDAEALFVRMEAAGMEADDATMLDAAVRLCEIGADAPGDLRVRLAAARVKEVAGNTPEFGKAIPHVQGLLANARGDWRDLHAALLTAAMDGAPGLDAEAVSRAAGILTDWRLVGPLGRHALLDYEEQAILTSEDLAQASYQSRWVENFQFPDGRIVLPEYLPHRGIFYAAARFAALTAGSWRAEVEGAGDAELYVDGRGVLRSGPGSGSRWAVIDVTPGPHRVVLKFAGQAAPLRIALWQTAAPERELSTNLSLQELTYLLAGEHYVAGEFVSAVKQIVAVGAATNSAALQWLSAQSCSARSLTMSECTTVWERVHALARKALSVDDALGQAAFRRGDLRGAAKLAGHVLAVRPRDARALETVTEATRGNSETAMEAQEEIWWKQRLVSHPSCETWRSATAYYRERGDFLQAGDARLRLNGCAPESLDYTQSLSGDGDHAKAAAALQQLLAAAPLNRAARLMLVRELQLAGQDEAAERAAMEWLRVAPNAENYHRLAAATPAVGGRHDRAKESLADEFYTPYRRDGAAIARAAGSKTAGDAVVLLDDHVAISRADGSVSLYVHTVRRGLAAEGDELTLPRHAQILSLRVLHRDGTATAIDSRPLQTAPGLSADDAIDEEYVLHYAGDGGIPEHAEAFQFVFGSFNEQVTEARFVVLTPAGQADRGVVIASGDAPRMTSRTREGMLERVWEKETALEAGGVTRNSASGLAIIRVVEEEHGWTVPSNAEHHRRIETIHPGPRPEDS